MEAFPDDFNENTISKLRGIENEKKRLEQLAILKTERKAIYNQIMETPMLDFVRIEINTKLKEAHIKDLICELNSRFSKIEYFFDYEGVFKPINRENPEISYFYKIYLN